MTGRYPGYDVLSKRNSPSWNEQTRRVIEDRLAIGDGERRFLGEAEWMTLRAVCDRIMPQPSDEARPVPLAAMVDEKLAGNHGDGYRDARLPPLREAWQRGLAAIDSEARRLQGHPFHELGAPAQDAVLAAVQQGEASDPSWGDMPPAVFFTKRLLFDIIGAYYAHPTSWNEIGFGGPASPRGYVRLDFDRRDPWEAAEARPGHEEQARRENSRVG